MVHAIDPATIKMSHASENIVLIVAMCICGDGDCGFTATVYGSDFVHLPSRAAVAE